LPSAPSCHGDSMLAVAINQLYEAQQFGWKF